MSLVLYLPTDTAIGSSSSSTPTELHLLAGYEDGRVAHFSFTGSAKDAFDPPTAKKDESQGWKLLWDDKGHREACKLFFSSPRHFCKFSKLILVVSFLIFSNGYSIVTG